VDNDLITPTFKLKRPQLQRRYQREVDALYAGLKGSSRLSSYATSRNTTTGGAPSRGTSRGGAGVEMAQVAAKMQ
jgi:hypothetical protein